MKATVKADKARIKSEKARRKASDKLARKLTRKLSGWMLAACCLSPLALSLATAGCATADSPTAQRAQSITAEDVSVVVNLNLGLATNDLAAAGFSTNAVPMVVNVNVEVATAAQANDTEGSETATASPTLTPTNDVKPTTTFTYGLCSAGDGSDWIADLTDASARGLASYLRSRSSGNLILTKKDGSTETVTCKDGVCKPSTCAECVTCSPD